MSAEPSTAQVPLATPTWSGVIIYVVVLGLIDLSFSAIVSRGPPIGFAVIMTMFTGAVAGQTAFFALLAGWSGRHWIQGFALATFLSVVSFGLAAIPLVDEADSTFWGVFLLPPILMTATVPFWIARAVSGRRLTRRLQGYDKNPTSLKDYFILTAFLGIQFYLYNVAMDAFQVPGDQFVFNVVGIVPTLTVLGLLYFLPMGNIAFKSNEAMVGFGWQCGYGFVAFLVVVTILGVVSRGQLPGEAIAAAMFFIGSSTITFATGCGVMRAAGFEWRKRRFVDSRTRTRESGNVSSEAVSPWDKPEAEVVDGFMGEAERDGPPTLSSQASEIEQENRNPGDPTAPEVNLRHRPHIALRITEAFTTRVSYSVAGLLFFAFCGAVASFILDRSRLGEVGAYNSVGANLLADGGEGFANQEGEIVAIKFGAQTDNAKLEEYLEHSFVSEVDLSQTQINDQGLELLWAYPRLRKLNLAATACTADGISQLVAKGNLKALVLSGIPLTQKSLRKILDANRGNLGSLDISGCGLSFDDLKSVWKELPHTVSVRAQGLTDAQLETLVLLDPKHILDLRDNSLTGSFLLVQAVPTWRLRLEGNPITDAAVTAAVEARVHFSQLSLGGNKLTDKCLPVLMGQLSEDLTISESSFSEAAINKFVLSKNLQLNRLAIHDPNFRGSQLNFMPGFLGNLDLSHSGVTSDVFEGFNCRVDSLDLSHTEVDGKVLGYLDRTFSSSSVNLRGCPITSQDLLEFRSRYRFFNHQLTLGQLSDREVMNARRYGNIHFSSPAGDNLSWPW